MVENKYDENEGILYVKVEGVVGIEQMINGIDGLGNNNILSRNLKILEDAREAYITLNVNDVPLIFEKLKITLKNYKSLKHAVIHTDPLATAIAYLVENENNIENYKFAVFNTEQAARNWLKN